MKIWYFDGIRAVCIEETEAQLKRIFRFSSDCFIREQLAGHISSDEARESAELDAAIAQGILEYI